MTAENYYNRFFRYPQIPLGSEYDRFIPADYVDSNYLASIKIILVFLEENDQQVRCLIRKIMFLHNK